MSPPSRFAVDRPLRCPCPDPAPTGRFPVPSPTFPATQVTPETRRAPAPLVSGESSAAGTSAAAPTAVGEAKAAHPIPAVRSRSGGPVLIRPSPILAVRRRSNGPGPLPPHPASLPFGPRLSACPCPALPAGPACQPPRSRCPPGPACQPLRSPPARAPARGSNPGRPPEIQWP
jgi:hypothetical protein